MTILQIAILAFALLELSNIATLYFVPGSQKANGVGVFTAWEKSKPDPEIHAFVKYLVYWVAGTKLIFILLLIVISLFADANTQRLCTLALTVAIASFYWRLFPLVRKMDQQGQIAPKGYSKVLGIMIFAIIAVLLVATLVSFIPW